MSNSGKNAGVKIWWTLPKSSKIVIKLKSKLENRSRTSFTAADSSLSHSVKFANFVCFITIIFAPLCACNRVGDYINWKAATTHRRRASESSNVHSWELWVKSCVYRCSEFHFAAATWCVWCEKMFRYVMEPLGTTRSNLWAITEVMWEKKWIKRCSETS